LSLLFPQKGCVCAPAPGNAVSFQMHRLNNAHLLTWGIGANHIAPLQTSKTYKFQIACAP